MIKKFRLIPIFFFFALIFNQSCYASTSKTMTDFSEWFKHALGYTLEVPGGKVDRFEGNINEEDLSNVTLYILHELLPFYQERLQSSDALISLINSVNSLLLSDEIIEKLLERTIIRLNELYKRIESIERFQTTKKDWEEKLKKLEEEIEVKKHECDVFGSKIKYYQEVEFGDTVHEDREDKIDEHKRDKERCFDELFRLERERDEMLANQPSSFPVSVPADFPADFHYTIGDTIDDETTAKLQQIDTKRFIEEVEVFRKEFIDSLGKKRHVSNLLELENLIETLVVYTQGSDIYRLQGLESKLNSTDDVRHQLYLEEDERYIKERARKFDNIIKIIDGSTEFWLNVMTMSQTYDLVESTKKIILTSATAREIYSLGLTTPAELKNLNNKKIEILVSEKVIEACRLNLITFEELKDLDLESLQALYVFLKDVDLDALESTDNEKIKALVSADAKKLYRSGLLTLDQLKGHNSQQIKKTIAKKLAIYEKRIRRLGSIKGLSNDKLVALMADGVHKSRYVDINELKKMDSNKTRILTSNAANRAYELGLVTFQQLKDLDIKTLKELNIASFKNLGARRVAVLVSKEALEAYDLGFITIKQLKELDEPERMKAMVAKETLDAHRKKYVTSYKQLKNLSGPKIVVLVSPEAQRMYEKKFASVDQLKNFSIEKIKALISQQAFDAFDSERVKFCQLEDINDPKVIDAHTTKEAIVAYISGRVSVDQLKDIEDHNTIRALVTKEAVQSYVLDYVTVSQLKAFDSKKVRAITSRNAIKAFVAEQIKFDQIKDLSAEKIDMLVSDKARTIYRLEYADIDKLKDLDIEKIEILISDQALKAYKSGYVTVDQIKNLSIEKIIVFISDAALKTFSSEAIGATVDLIKDSDISRIRIIISEEANEACESKYTTITKLMDRRLDDKTVKALIAKSVIDAFKLKRVTFNQLKRLSPEKIAVLVSLAAQRTYENSDANITSDMLEKLEVSRIVIFTSNEANAAYSATYAGSKYVTYTDLKDENLSDEKVKALITKKAIDSFKAGHTTFDQLKVLPINKIKALVSSAAQRTYENKDANITSSMLEELAVSRIEIVTSDEANEAYSVEYDGSKYATFDDLKDENLSDEKVKALITKKAIDSFKAGHTTFDQLKVLPINKIKALVSSAAQRTYENSDANITADKLKVLETSKIKIFTSKEANEAFSSEYVKFDQLKDLNNKKILDLISAEALETYKNSAGGITPDLLMSLDSRKIKIFISEEANKAYASGHVTVNQLKDLDNLNIIRFLISQKALEAYESGDVTCEQLKNVRVRKTNTPTSYEKQDILGHTNSYHKANHKQKGILASLLEKYAAEGWTAGSSDIDKMKAIISEEVLKAYESGLVIFDDLVDLDDLYKIALFVSKEALNAYESEYVRVDELKSDDLNNRKIKALISTNANNVHKSRRITSLFDQLKVLSADKIDLLVSNGAQEIYRNDLEKFHQLKDMDIAKIRALISKNAFRAYKTDYTRFGKLKNLSVEKIILLVSNEAQEIHRNGFITPDQPTEHATFELLKDFNIEKIKALTSRQAINAFKLGYITFDLLKGLDARKIRSLTSDDAETIYRFTDTAPEDLMNLSNVNLNEKIGILVKQANRNFSQVKDKISGSIFNKLFGNGSARKIERSNIEQDSKDIVYNIPKNLFNEILRSQEDLTEHPLTLYLAAQYLKNTDWTTASYILGSRGIQFRDSFTNFSKPKVINFIQDYSKLNIEEMETIKGLAQSISSNIYTRWSRIKYTFFVNKIMRESYNFDPDSYMIVLSDLIKQCGKEDAKQKLLKIARERKLDNNNLVEIYRTAFRKMKDPSDIARVLEETTIDIELFLLEN